MDDILTFHPIGKNLVGQVQSSQMAQQKARESNSIEPLKADMRALKMKIRPKRKEYIIAS